MGDKAEQVINALREFEEDKTREIEAAHAENLQWLSSTISGAKDAILALLADTARAPKTSKKRSKEVDTSLVHQPPKKKAGGKGRRARPVLETVEEEVEAALAEDQDSDRQLHNSLPNADEIQGTVADREKPSADSAASDSQLQGEDDEPAASEKPVNGRKTRKGNLRAKAAATMSAEAVEASARATRSTRQRQRGATPVEEKSNFFPSPPNERKLKGRTWQRKGRRKAASPTTEPSAVSEDSTIEAPPNDNTDGTAHLNSSHMDAEGGAQPAEGGAEPAEAIPGTITENVDPEASLSHTMQPKTVAAADEPCTVEHSDVEISEAPEEAPAEMAGREELPRRSSTPPVPAAEERAHASVADPKTASGSYLEEKATSAMDDMGEAHTARGSVGHGEACAPQRADGKTVEKDLQESVPGEETQCDKADAAPSELAEAQETAGPPQCQPLLQPSVAEDDMGSVEAEGEQSKANAARELSVDPSAAEQESARVSTPGQELIVDAAIPESVPDSEFLSPSQQPHLDGDPLSANLNDLQVALHSANADEKDFTQQTRASGGTAFFSQLPESIQSLEIESETAEDADEETEDLLHEPQEAGRDADVGSAEVELPPSEDEQPHGGANSPEEEDVVEGKTAAPQVPGDAIDAQTTSQDESNSGHPPEVVPDSEEAEAEHFVKKSVLAATANLVTSFRSLVPTKPAAQSMPGAGRRAPEVDALKAAEAARKKEAAREAERQKQREQLKKQKAERARHTQQVKAKLEEAHKKAAEDARRREEAMRRKEEDASNRRKAKEEAERREREDRQKRLDEAKAKKKQEELRKQQELKQQELARRRAEEEKAAARMHKAAHPDAAGPSRPKVADFFAKAEATLLAPVKAAPAELVSKGATAEGASRIVASQCAESNRPLPGQQGIQSIEIAPYRSSDEESDDEDDKKPRPLWAQEPNLRNKLIEQQRLDPDEIFQQNAKTCSLDEVFSNIGAARDPKRDLNRRTSTGNWLEDRVTWKEEMNYKKAMGYL